MDFLRDEIAALSLVKRKKSWEAVFPARVEWFASIGNTPSWFFVVRKKTKDTLSVIRYLESVKMKRRWTAKEFARRQPVEGNDFLVKVMDESTADAMWLHGIHLANEDLLDEGLLNWLECIRWSPDYERFYVKSTLFEQANIKNAQAMANETLTTSSSTSFSSSSSSSSNTKLSVPPQALIVKEPKAKPVLVATDSSDSSETEFFRVPPPDVDEDPPLKKKRSLKKSRKPGKDDKAPKLALQVESKVEKPPRLSIDDVCLHISFSPEDESFIKALQRTKSAFKYAEKKIEDMEQPSIVKHLRYVKTIDEVVGAYPACMVFLNIAGRLHFPFYCQSIFLSFKTEDLRISIQLVDRDHLEVAKRYFNDECGCSSHTNFKYIEWKGAMTSILKCSATGVRKMVGRCASSYIEAFKTIQDPLVCGWLGPKIKDAVTDEAVSNEQPKVSRKTLLRLEMKKARHALVDLTDIPDVESAVEPPVSVDIPEDVESKTQNEEAERETAVSPKSLKRKAISDLRAKSRSLMIELSKTLIELEQLEVELDSH